MDIVCSDDAICGLLKVKYDNLYNSVSYDPRDMNSLLNEVSYDIQSQSMCRIVLL
jgi:hypothetical protein